MVKKLLEKKQDFKSIGQRGEDLAVKYLKKLEYQILDRNWFNKKGKRLGEIDIVAENEAGTIIFVEVKARKISRKTAEKIIPEEQITQRKMLKLQKITEKYISQNDLWDADWRFDAISIIFDPENKKPEINHIENIFF